MILTDNLSDRLLAPTELTENHLSALMGTLQSKAIHEADIYFQEMRSESWVLENNIIKSGAFSIARGAGIRAVSGEKSALAYTEDLRLPRLQEACQAVRTIAATGGEGIVQIAHQPVIRNVNEAFNPYERLSTDEKLALLRRANQIARESDPRITEVIVSLNGGCEIILLMNQEGQIFTDVRPLVRFTVSVLITDGDKREQGSYGGGGRHDIRQFIENNSAETFAKAAVREAIIKLDARPAPAGTMPVVLGPGWPGVLLHEAVGHGLEGDFNRKGTSTFTGRIGERVATELCTIVDDGTLPGLRGSENIDDEGTPSGRTVLIEKGILKGYLQDKMNARLMKSQPTGNGRRESYSVQPLPRMTNTFMLAGDSEPEEIIRSVKKGLYAVNFAGGQVDITSGKFVFSASEAYLIEDGKVTAPVKGATLIGNGPDALKHVSMVGNDLKLDPGIGVCGKDGQSVPVGVGQPTLKLDAMTVGGTEV